MRLVVAASIGACGLMSAAAGADDRPWWTSATPCPDGASLHIRGAHYVCEDESGVRHGRFVELGADGSRLVQGSYRQGRHHGTWTWWSDSGTILGTASYQNGTGEHVAYFRDGGIRQRGRLEHGRRVGSWVFYRDDGTRAAVVVYSSKGERRFLSVYRRGARIAGSAAAAAALDNYHRRFRGPADPPVVSAERAVWGAEGIGSGGFGGLGHVDRRIAFSPPKTGPKSGIDPGAALNTLQWASGALGQCYSKLLASRPGLRGALVARLAITRTGEVKRARITGFGGATFASCARRTLSAIRFSSPGRPARMSVTIRFAAAKTVARAGLIVVDPRLDRRTVRSQLEATLPGVRRCYHEALADDGLLEGQLVARFTLAPNRRSAVEVDGLAVSLERCARRLLESVVLPAPADASPAQVSITYELHPAER